MLGLVQDADIRLLRVFHTIAECGGFSRAQAKLNLSQSAISTHMTQLQAHDYIEVQKMFDRVFKPIS